MFFYQPEELKNLAETELPICLVPTSPSFPSLDAVVLTTNSVITVQITIAHYHSAEKRGFDLIFDNLSRHMLSKRPERYHLFITDEEENAESLREQNLTEIPMGTRVYSVVVDTDQLDVITEERVEALEEARAPPENLW